MNAPVLSYTPLMYALTRFWQSTIGKKIVMAVTGVILVGFVLVHMTGNLQVLGGAEKINHYAQLLRTSMPLLWFAAFK